MLFNSPEFIVGFLPVTLLGYLLLTWWEQRQLAFAWLVACSLFFYGWWFIGYLPVLIVSLLVNFAIGVQLARRHSRALLIFGIAANLCAIAFFKYTMFLVETVNAAAGVTFPIPAVALPLAISFFTFQQIAYLIDAYDGRVKEPKLVNYALFITFFPQLIAGPIVHHKEMMPQFERKGSLTPQLEDFVVGISVFAIGLFKKVVLADGIAIYSSRVFAATQSGDATVTFFEAWGGAVCFTLQIYFDFSGYSDMAIGLSRLFGIRLPLNFASPYKAPSIIDFWARWHMTLTRFLTAYVYNPVVMRLTRQRMAAGRPTLRRDTAALGPFLVLLAFPTMLTMFLAGVWHGAGWQFIIFGLLHGSFLVINHAWRMLARASGLAQWRRRGLFRPAAVLLTFLCVVVAMVFFRAVSLTHALAMLEGMAGLNGVLLPEQFSVLLAHLPGLAERIGYNGTLLFGGTEVLAIALLLVFVWVLPNTQEWMAGFGVGIDAESATGRRAGDPPRRIGLIAPWRPTPVYGAYIGAIFCITLLVIFSGSPSEFLYFNF